MLIQGRLQNREPGIDVLSPYTGQCVGTVSADAPADVRQAIGTLSAHAYGLPPRERRRVLLRTAELVAGQAEELARLITSEAGICLRDSRAEVARARGNLEVAAEEAVRIRGETQEVVVASRPSLALWIREPMGVVAAITPFNRPLNQVVVKLAPALAAGNRVIVKPSEKAPLSALRLAWLLLEAGLPDSMLAVVTGRPAELAGPLLTSADVDMVTFTGSVETGQRIAREAAGKKLLLELGGNDPLVVLPDADPDEAAAVAVTGAFGSAGQSCRGIKRVVAVGSIADELVERLGRRAKLVRWGDPFDPETEVGPLIGEEAACEAERRCAQAVADGADLVVGGNRVGALFSPTVLDHVPPATDLVCLETFAPIAPVIRVASLEAALDVCNGTRYGLQAGVMTRSFEAFAGFAAGLRVGGVALGTGPNFDSPLIPFGGVKGSGFGREGIRHAIEEMTALKTVLLPWR